jgi:protease I
LQTDIRNAGGNWVDEEVVTDTDGPNVLISSRKPEDLKAFCNTVISAFSSKG